MPAYLSIEIKHQALPSHRRRRRPEARELHQINCEHKDETNIESLRTYLNGQGGTYYLEIQNFSQERNGQ